MREVLFRDRNLRYAETLFLATQQQQIQLLLLELLGLPSDELKKRQDHLQKLFQNAIHTYGAELYGDRYLPGARQAEAERQRQERIRQLEEQQRSARMIERVNSW